MTTCPKCKKEIETLTEDRTQKAYYSLNGAGDYQLNDYGDVLESSFFCPECDAKLDLKTEQEAIDFLNSAI